VRSELVGEKREARRKGGERVVSDDRSGDA